jgi:hypothetical protein
MALTAAVPAWLSSSTTLSDPVWEWLVFLLCRAGRRCWCSMPTRGIAAALGKKEDTGTAIAREVLATGLVERLLRRDGTLWIINTEALAMGRFAPEWQPSQALQDAVIADHTARRAYAARHKDLSEDLELADHRLAAFSAADYGGEQDLLELAQRKDQANYAFALAKIENERFIKASGLEGNAISALMLADPAFAAAWRQHNGVELQRQDQHQWLVAQWNGLRMDAQETVSLARKRLWEHQQKQPTSPEELMRTPLPRGTYSITPRGLMTKDFQRTNHLRDASGVRRLLMVLLGLARGARIYRTTIEGIADRMGRHRETVGRGLRVLHDAGHLKGGYLMAKERTKEFEYSHAEGRLKAALVDGISPSRIRGVELTFPCNRTSTRVRSELSSGLLDVMVYDQPRRAAQGEVKGPCNDRALRWRGG